MKIAITSGKGGVGKTFVAACLARVLSGSRPVRYIDCDVEAPNAHLFLRPDVTYSEPQSLACIIGMDPDKCTHCARCAKTCYFNALIVGKNAAMAFPELCRWCGACRAVCPADALVVGKRTIGTVYRGQSGNIDLHWATLQAGAGGMTVRLIRHIQRQSEDMLTILDSPPGTSCAVVQTIRDADRIILVADPTRFGQHDLKLSVHLCRAMKREPLVLINRAGIGDLEQLRRWCRSANVDILAEIPDDRRIAEYYSTGLLPIEYMDDLKDTFLQIAQTLSAAGGRQKQRTATAVDPSLFLETPNLSPENPGKTQSHLKKPREIVIISGKGGTGKTSLAACFAQLAGGVIADCDVDAADLHLLLAPQVLSGDTFIGGRVMSIDPARCTACGQCITICQWEAITAGPSVTVIPERCEGCGACLVVCPAQAVLTQPTQDGRYYWSSTRFGGMSHATLEPGKENSGKLVTLVRSAAAQHSKGASIAILDGSPGTGCPVIASIGGAAAAVIVTEPTVSGLHDLKRILELTRHFQIPAGIIINKNDLNPHVSDQIRQTAAEQKAVLLGELPYDRAFIEAQQNGQTLLEYQPDSDLANAVKRLWINMQPLMKETGTK